jgi:hypothetical protein
MVRPENGDGLMTKPPLVTAADHGPPLPALSIIRILAAVCPTATCSGRFHLSFPRLRQAEGVMKILDRVKDRVRRFEEMAAKSHVAFDERHPYVLEDTRPRALVRCMLCRHRQTCREWLDSDEGSRGSPGFCPNARFVGQNQPPAPGAGCAPWPLFLGG